MSLTGGITADGLHISWVPNWEFLSARYAAMVIQPYKFIQIKNTGQHTTDHTSGLLGISITPLALSWDLHNNFHIGAGLAIYLPDGKTAYTRNAATGRKETSGDNVSWDYGISGRLNPISPSAI
ncbi:TPA: transporter [Escherichia coli]|nr:transporter [Escherichia coli]